MGDSKGRWEEPVSFLGWNEALERADIASSVKAQYRSAIARFLRYLQSIRSPATALRAKNYLAALEKQAGAYPQIATEALRWFFRSAMHSTALASGRAVARDRNDVSSIPQNRTRPLDSLGGSATPAGSSDRASAHVRLRTAGGKEAVAEQRPPSAGTPVLSGRPTELSRIPQKESVSIPTRLDRHIPAAAAEDLGNSPEEQALIRACRERGFLWRTEETYRRWLEQFAAFIRPKQVATAGMENIEAFLSNLATQRRATPRSMR